MILLLSHSRDFGTDDLVTRFRAREIEYRRLDIDLLPLDEVVLDPLLPALHHRLPGGEVCVVKNPLSVLYRAPTHLRESSGHRYSPEELLARHQWTAFCRSLTVFRATRWVNHPTATFAAESKPYQLSVARDCGFAIPETYVANTLPHAFRDSSRVAVKSLDSFLIRRNGLDHFFYTMAMTPEACTNDACQEMPLIMQTFLTPKIDLRVTVVGEKCFVAETTEVVQGDWRRQKDMVSFRRVDSEGEVPLLCSKLVRELGLVFGAIDLAVVAGRVWFLEINPTGEWAWIDSVFDGEISAALGDYLSRPRESRT